MSLIRYYFFQALPRPEDGWVPVHGPLPPPKSRNMNDLQLLKPKRVSNQPRQTPVGAKPPSARQVCSHITRSKKDPKK